MKLEERRKLERERDALGIDKVVSARAPRVQIVAPTVTRRPVIDETLGFMSVIAHANLELMKDKALTEGYAGMTSEERKDFTELAQAIIRQARAEMEIEKHVEERDKSFKDKELAEDIAGAMMEICEEMNLPDKDTIVLKLLDAVGLEL